MVCRCMTATPGGSAQRAAIRPFQSPIASHSNTHAHAGCIDCIRIALSFTRTQPKPLLIIQVTKLTNPWASQRHASGSCTDTSTANHCCRGRQAPGQLHQKMHTQNAAQRYMQPTIGIHLHHIYINQLYECNNSKIKGEKRENTKARASQRKGMHARRQAAHPSEG